MGIVGDNVKKYRTFRGIKQQELADALGKSKSVISNWERGENSPDVEICAQICKILKVTPNELFGWEDNKEYSNYQKRLLAYQFQIEKLTKQKETIEQAIHALENKKFKEFPPEDFIED